MATNDVWQRTRVALELVADPVLRAVVDDPLDSERLLHHAWGLVKSAYGVSLGRDFYSVHRVDDPRNCVWLTTKAEEADNIARWWPGYQVTVTPVTAVDRWPERWIAMGVALHWRRPEWLTKKK